jgi:peptide/nickel transport system substrate-binding protein
MMRLRGRTRWAALLLIGFTAACVDRESADGDLDGEPQYGGTVVIAAASDLDNLNTLVTSDDNTMEVAAHVIFLPLVRYTSDLDYEPALAERWELLGDTGVVFHLRRDVRWHDGRPTTARDVLFTYERAVDPETAFPQSDYFARWIAASAPDSFTVRFSFEPHVEPLAGLPFLPIMPAHLLDSIPAARMRQAAFNRQPVGNGPFRFLEYRPGDRWIFEANPDYPQALGGRPYIDRLVWRVVPESAAQLIELSTGSADIVLTAMPDDFQRLSGRSGISGYQRTTRQFANVMWNNRRAPLADPQVRKALSMAIDRQQMIDLARAGYGQLAVGPIGPYHWAYDQSIEPLPFDPDGARALLEEAGLQDRNGDGFRQDAAGRPVNIELKYPGTSIISRDIAEMTRSNLANVGVRVTLRPIDWSAMVADFTSPDRNFDAIVLAWNSDFRINLRDSFHSGSMDSQNQIASYTNARVDTLIDRAAVVYDRDAARGVYSELQRILRDEQPWSFLYYYEDLILRRDRLRNVDMDIRGKFLNVDRWWVTGGRAAAASPDGSADRSPDPDSVPGQ